MTLKSFLFFGLTLLACTVLITACVVEDSADVNQDKIYADYELFYNSNTDKTQVLAKFRFGGITGTVLQLNDPAEVTFNGDKLAWKPIYQGHFKEYSGRVTEGTFIYTNIDEQSFTNDIPVYESIDFPENLDSISKSESYDFKWVGTALSENQSVGLFVGSWTWGQDALFHQNSLGADNIILGKNQLGNLPDGKSVWYLDRSTQTGLTEGTSEGGYIRAKFRAENIEVTVVP